MNIIFYEPQCSGLSHVDVNSSYIQLCGKVFPGHNMIFFGENEHIALIKKSLKDKSLNVLFIPVSIISGKTSRIAKIYNILNIVRSVIVYSTNINDHIIILSINSQTLIAIKLYSVIYKKNIHIIIHGILETIIKKPNRILGNILWFKNCLGILNNKYIKYIVLEHYIIKNLLSIIPNMEKYTHVNNLPFDLAKSSIGVYRENNTSKILFISAGYATIDKGSHLFFKLAKECFEDRFSNNIEFSYIGKTTSIQNTLIGRDCVTVYGGNSAVDMGIYHKMFLKADYIIFFYPIDSYKLTFSGVFHDAVKYEIPIIALRNELFSFYFNKYGRLGWLCDNYDELFDLVKNLSVSIDISILNEIALNFKKFKLDYSDDKQILAFKKLFN